MVDANQPKKSSNPYVIAAAMSGSDQQRAAMKLALAAVHRPRTFHSRISTIESESSDTVPDDTPSQTTGTPSGEGSHHAAPSRIEIRIPFISCQGDPNGTYQQTQTTLNDGRNMYYKEGTWNAKPVTFVIYHSLHNTSIPQSHCNTRHWFLGTSGGIQPLFISRGTNIRKPPNCAWLTCMDNTMNHRWMTTPIINDVDKKKIVAQAPQEEQQKHKQTPNKKIISTGKTANVIVVQGSGIPEINGTYSKSCDRNGYPSYIIQNQIEWDGIPGRFILLRDAFYWSIGFQHIGKNDIKRTCYRSTDRVTKSKVAPPPCSGWITVGVGVEPPPTFGMIR